MPIPPFDEDGLLPPGIHSCTIEEIQRRFGRFTRSDRRQTLMARLETLVNDARSARMPRSVMVNGSSVTDKDEPNDVDLIIVTESEREGQRLGAVEYNLLS